MLENGKGESFKHQKEIKKEKEFKRKPLREKVGKENQTIRVFKKKTKAMKEQILQIASQAHFPDRSRKKFETIY